MKRFRILILAAVAAILSLGLDSCTKKELPEQEMEISPTNLAGTWQLAQWNGAPLPSSAFFYIVLERRDRSFIIYQNIDSMLPRRITGTWNLETDPYLGSVISGTYDYGVGNWSNEYVISSLMPSGTVIWAVKGNPKDVTLYTRCDTVPSDILEKCAE